jgi:hypothetical protein
MADMAEVAQPGQNGDPELDEILRSFHRAGYPAEEACVEIGTSLRQLRRLVQAGELVPLKLSPRRETYLATDLARLLLRKRREAEARRSAKEKATPS